MKVYFARNVKYKGKRFKSFEKFDVDLKDLEELKSAGAFVLDEPAHVEEVEVEEEPDAKELEKKQQIQDLREQADELGIEYKNNWGIPKLTEALMEAAEESE